jgi:hypothetical protein
MVLFPLAAACTFETNAQLRPTLKVKLDVSPAVEVSSLDQSVQASFAKEIAKTNGLIPMGGRGGQSLHVGPGFAISAYENITVLVSVTPPASASSPVGSKGTTRITCGYLNDGTSYFRRSTITNRNTVSFRLRNNGLLRRSMKLQNPLLVAYIFFIVDEPRKAEEDDDRLPVSNVTVEFI